ncbi:hypothetical protein RA086_05045 [Lactiplantibacillus sp. WILCCON 0030]|uniref:Cell surface protein n=1 Tax=Lactiplantibacillus brownii TaxID=3069269 RepID=A0ABU1A7S7_9LACO|nr:hypothetical protein [Lactiplantibacillus brownii]MDQ7937009.1 hypothetical protein [Lactiplantibacillus brownii]
MMRKIIISFLIGLGLGGLLWQTVYAEDLPFPDSSVGNYVFGVGSYYNAFAAGKLTINSSPIDTLEGRYAARQIVSAVDTFNDGKVWNKLSQFSPVYVANEVPYQSTDSSLKTTGQNLFKIFNTQDKLPDADKIVVNNLRDQLQHDWTATEKQSNAVLIKHLADENVGDVNYFKDNVASLEAAYQVEEGKSLTLDPTKADATDYFDAAADQIRRISDYYASFNDKQDTLANGGVDGVTVQNDLSGTNPEVTIKLSDDYDKSFDDTPPMIFLNLKGSPQNVTINIENMSTSVVNTAATSDSSYATYQYAPYIFVNWTGVKTSMPFSWGSAYKFSVTDISGQKITNASGDDVTNSDGSKATLNQLLSSHILNNFPNATTADGSYLTADTGSSSDLFAGSIMAPDASIRVSNVGSTQFFYGSIISGKDILIENNMLPARVIASSFDVEHISSDSISELDPSKPQVPAISKVTLSQGSTATNSKTVGDGATADYSAQHADGAVTLTARVIPRKTPYQLFYQLNGKAWRLLTNSAIDATQSSNELDLGKLTDLNDANAQTLTATGKTTTQAADYDPTQSADTTQTISAELARKNQLKLVVMPLKADSGTTITADNVSDYLSTYAPTTVNIAETGTAAATLPTVFDFEMPTGDTVLTASPTVQVTNDWQVPVSLSLAASTALTTPLSDGAQPLSSIDWVRYTATVDAVATAHHLSTTATTLLPATSPPTTTKQLAFTMTIDPADYPADVQAGKRYFVPFTWQLNYGLTAK